MIKVTVNMMFYIILALFIIAALMGIFIWQVGGRINVVI